MSNEYDNDINSNSKSIEDKANLKNDDDEISLIDLFAVLLRYKKMIIAVTVAGMVLVLALSVISLILPPEKSFLPNKYTPTAQMLINDSNSSSMSSALQGFSGVASMMGVNIPGGGSTYSSLATFLVSSNSILDAVVDKYDLIQRWEIEKSPRANSREALKKVLISSFDDESGVFSISFTDIDPEFAQDVVNFVVDLLEQRFKDMGIDKNQLTKENLEENIKKSYEEIVRLQNQIQGLEKSVSNAYTASGVTPIMIDSAMMSLELKVQEEVYSQLKAQYEMTKVSMASEQPIFQILEYAEVPDRKSKPSRGKLCIIVSMASFFIAVFIAFLLNAINNIKKDPEAMTKLTGKAID